MLISEIILCVLITCFGVQIIYQIVFVLRVSIHKNQPLNQSFGVSVIICCRNEESNLKKFLPKILNQKYDNYELIVVNDRSWDSSVDYLNEIKKKYDNIKVVTIPDNGTDHFGKKLAITLGVKAAKYEHLIFTDADCYPVSGYWLKELSSAFTSKKEIVLGASSFVKEKGLLNSLIRFDTAQIAINYLGFAKSSNPYMGVGRNLAYKKKTYERVSGFKSHYHIESGDDDLFINQVAKSKNTEIVFSSNSITLSKAKTSWSSWIRQKRRHHTTNYFYKKKDKILLLIGYLSVFFYYLSIFLLILSWKYKTIVLFVFMIRTLFLTLLYYRPFKILLCKDLLLAVPIYEIILLFCYPIFQLNLHRRKK